MGAYVSAVIVLHNGTLVSGFENGHIKLWRHGEQIRHIAHEMPEALERLGVPESGVTCLVPVSPSPAHSIAFVTEGMIIALQKLPTERDDKKMETYKYNSLVTGLPQRQIEEILQRRRESDGDRTMLLGECAMTLGLELGRAYVSAVIVLHNGTLVSGFEN